MRTLRVILGFPFAMLGLLFFRIAISVSADIAEMMYDSLEEMGFDWDKVG